MKRLLIVMSLASSMALGQTGGKLDVSSYMKQVEKGHKGYRASSEISDGAGARAGEAGLITGPVLQFSAQNGVDEKPSTQPTFTGTKNSQTLYNLSILQQTPIGLSGKLGYTYQHRVTEGAAPTVVPIPDYYTGSPSLELTQSLWKNGFGSEVRAMKQAAEGGARATQYMERFKASAALAESEATFYRLHAARVTVQALQESYALAEKFRNWAAGRVNNGLGDQSDLIQARAALESRGLDLLAAKNEELAARRSFNLMRGVSGDDVPETLEAGPIPKSPPRLASEVPVRDDVRALHAGAQASEAAARLGKEKNKPTLDLYGSYAWNGLDVEGSKAQSNSFKNDHPTWGVGVRFSTPLAFLTASDAREGYQREADGAALSFEHRREEARRDYLDLTEKVETAAQTLTLASSLELTQKDKLARERLKLERGRTVTAQVILFEQEYIGARLLRIRTEAQLRTLQAQLKLYKSGSDL